MTRLLGAVLLLVAGGGLGLSLCSQLGRRRRTVALLVEVLYQMEREMTLHLTPLPTLLQGVEPPLGQYFSICGDAVGEGLSLRPCWDRLVDGLPHIGGEERELLRPLGAVLGQFEGEVQGEALRRVADQLAEHGEMLRQEGQRLGRVYPAVGLTAGAFLGILLL